MNNLNLILKFRLAQSSGVQVRGATRINVDGLGGLIVYDAETGRPERIPLAQVNSLCIESLSSAGGVCPTV
jgi:hypothetical protein